MTGCERTTSSPGLSWKLGLPPTQYASAVWLLIPIISVPVGKVWACPSGTAVMTPLDSCTQTYPLKQGTVGAAEAGAAGTSATAATRAEPARAFLTNMDI